MRQLEPPRSGAKLRANQTPALELVDGGVRDSVCSIGRCIDGAARPTGGDESTVDPCAHVALADASRRRGRDNRLDVKRRENLVDVPERLEVVGSDLDHVGRQRLPEAPARHLELHRLGVLADDLDDASSTAVDTHHKQIPHELLRDS